MAADAQLGVIADWALGRTPAAGPLILGITGAVAAGKSTFAADLAQALAGSRPRVELVCSDGFLHTNQTLTGLDLLNRKGFPETFDSDAQVRALTEIRTGTAVFPAHSHVTYDIDPALSRTLSGVDVLIIEGLNLRRNTAPVDGLIYIDADEALLEAWYVARFMGLWEAAEHDPTSFYVRFRQMSRDQVEALAHQVWTGVNLPNLRQHIVLARDEAELVVTKGPDHAIVSVQARG